jgi:hypothetical protein
VIYQQPVQQTVPQMNTYDSAPVPPPSYNEHVAYPQLNDQSVSEQPPAMSAASPTSATSPTAPGSDDANDVISSPKDVDEVRQWLATLNMQGYADTFIENGYDTLEAISDISRDDLKDMGVKLGHIKLILASSINANFLNKNVRLKNVHFETYVSNYGPPEKLDEGARCHLQHNEKGDKPGCLFAFEILDGAVFRLRHIESGTFLKFRDDLIVGRSPYEKTGGLSQLVLEKAEQRGIYYIKCVKNGLYLQCEVPRQFGKDILKPVKEKVDRAKFQLIVERTWT